jgi:phosphohistidine phosphatase
MKLLYLVRHAKSSWAEPGLADIDRPLNKRGKRDAPEMGRRLKERDAVPDRIVTSPAKRARGTTRDLVRGPRGKLTGGQSGKKTDRVTAPPAIDAGPW